MLAGIENLGDGLLKGYQFGLQQQRQQQQDARQATLDQQNQEQHDLSMKSNQFNLDQAQKKATLDDATQARTLNFNKTLQQAVLMNKSGNKQGAFTTLVQGNNNDPQATHNIEFLGLDDSGMGSIRYIDKATGKPVGDGKLSAEDAIVMFHQTLDPAKAFADEQNKKEKEKEAAAKLANDLLKQEKENKGRVQVANINAAASAADNETVLKNTQMQLDAGKYDEKTKAGKNKFGSAYIFKQAEGVLTQAESDLLSTQMQQQVNTVQASDNPQVRQAAFNSLFGQAKSFAGRVLRNSTLKQQEDYAKELTARQFGDGTYSYDDLYRAVFKKNTPSNANPKVTPLSDANRAVTPANSQTQPPKIIAGLNNGFINDPKTKHFLFGQ
jgi:hypothetical protein